MSLNRKERKEKAKMKRQKIRLAIHAILVDALKDKKTLEEAVTLADEYIYKEIRLCPQDKELILSAAYQVQEILDSEIAEAERKGNGLIEPSGDKIKKLIVELEVFTEVRIKSNLRRLGVW